MPSKTMRHKFLQNLVDNEDYVSEAINKVGKIISDELASCPKKIPDDVTADQTSATLMKLLEVIHVSLTYGPKPQLINSMILSTFTGRSTSLQCMLGGYFRNIPVKGFNKLSKYAVVCSYDELQQRETNCQCFCRLH